VISIRGTVRPGNSGGPLVADDGVVYGMVFAASLTDPETGYALAVSELGPALEDAPAAVEPVSTAACA
jgi:S1-C subfamily serine protease